MHKLNLIFERLNMKIIITSLLILFFPTSSSALSYGNVTNVIYVKNYDADTITFNIPGWPDIIGEKMSVRVRGIDSPEIRGKCEQEKLLAREAKQFVQEVMEKGWYIELHEISKGKYFRIVAEVVVDGLYLSNLLILKKLAVRYNGGTKMKDWCE